MCQDTIIDPISPDIITEPRRIELDCKNCEFSTEGYVRVILTFKDSLSPLVLEDVEISELVTLDPISKKYVYKYNSKDTEIDSYYLPFIDEMIINIKKKKYYIPKGQCRKYFTRRTDYVFPFTIKAIG